MVSSAISLRAITVVLSLSFSTVGFSPEWSFLALFDATKTKLKSTLKFINTIFNCYSSHRFEVLYLYLNNKK